MKVVLDSNVFISDFRLNKTSFQVLFESIKKGDIQVYVPEIVFHEVLNKYKQRLESAMQTIDSQLRTFEKLTEIDITHPIEEKTVDNAVNQYEKFLMEKFKEYNIEFIEYPKTDHEYIAKKAMLKKKPFNTNEKGYRDALIWESIKTELSDSEDVTGLPELVFVTGNSKDFAGEDQKLHSDLIEELEQESFNSESVVLNNDLIEFNEERIKLFLHQENSFKKALQEDSDFGDDLKATVDDYLFKNLIGSEVINYDKDGVYDDHEYTVNMIDESSYTIKIDSVKKLNSSDYLIDVSFNIICILDFFIDRYSGLLLEDEEITIQDPNWNNYVMWVSKEATVQVEMSLIVGTDLDVTSLEINESTIL